MLRKETKSMWKDWKQKEERDMPKKKVDKESPLEKISHQTGEHPAKPSNMNVRNCLYEITVQST